MDIWQMAGIYLTIICATVAFVWFVFLLLKLLKARNIAREMWGFLGVAWFFLFLGITYFLQGWFDFSRWANGMSLDEIIGLGTILGAIGYTGICFLCEYSLRKTKFLGTAYLTVIAGILALLILLNFPMDFYQQFIIIAILPISPLFPIIFYLVFFKATAGYLKRRAILMVIGVLSGGIGAIFRADWITNLLGMSVYIIGTIGLIFGFIVAGYALSAYSTLTDIRWKEKLRQLYVIAEGGLCLYAFSFERITPMSDSDLAAGGFSGIQTLLAEMVQTQENLQMIDYQNLKIMLEKVKETSFVLIIKEESSFLRYKLQQFSHDFQETFNKLLTNWTGTTDVFAPAKILIQKIFEI